VRCSFATVKLSAFHPKTADDAQKFLKYAVGMEAATILTLGIYQLSVTRSITMKKHEAAAAQPGIEPNTSKESRLNTPNDKELQVDWQKKKGDGDKSRKLRGNDAKRLKHGEKGA
jgi:hypothetical protein